jgi:predicted RNA binding protein YcfA (HicA-like mRNA interferase family)
MQQPPPEPKVSNMKKASDVFKSIRFAKSEPRGKPHSSTDEEGHYTVGEKEFNQQLKHVKKMAMQEEVKDKYDEGEYDREGDMAKSDLRSIIDNAKKLHDMIDDADNLPEWVQSKITKAEDYISTVANYMTAEINEEVEYLEEKNAPTNPELWSRAKALAKSKFDVYPSAYANGWAAKWYKSKGGGWKTVSEETEVSEAMRPGFDYTRAAREKEQMKAKGFERGDRPYTWKKTSQPEQPVKKDEKPPVNEEIEQLDEMPGANMDTRAVHAHLKKKGWSLSRTSGGHDVYTHPEAEHHISVPRHRQLKAPLVKGILKQSIVREDAEQVDEGLGAVVAKVINKVTAANKTPLPQKSERRQFETPGKPNTPTKTNEEFDDQIIENALGFLKEGRPSQQHPLEGHDYHKKTDAQLKYIAKDAHEAAEAMKGHNTQAENKYRDQANDSATVRYWRQKHGMPDWYKKKYGHIKEEKEDVPFDPPYKKSSANITDKSGAKHTGASRAKHLAKMAMKKQTEKMKKPRLEEEKDAEFSNKTKIVRNALKDGKKKVNDADKTAGGKDKFEANPELTSQIVKT